MTYLRWLRHRFIFLKTLLISLFDAMIYQKQSQFLLHKSNAHRCPYDFILFYNAFGRILFSTKEFIALITNNKVFTKSITIDGFDAEPNHATLYQKGNRHILWPKSPMIQTSSPRISDEYYDKIANSFFLAYHHNLNKHNVNQKDISHEWERITTEFRTIFFDKENKIIKKNIENFRSDPKIYNKIFNDQYPYINSNHNHARNYLTAIDLVTEYHRYGSKINKELLASISESRAGNYLSINYRGKKLSEQLLQNMVVANDIIQNVPFSTERRNKVLDIGAGFGGSARILSYYTPNTTHILLDLPETLFLTAYYLKYNFPNKKIAVLEDIYAHLDRFNEIIEKYDFIIIPPFVLEYIEAESMDLVMNAASLAFMSQAYLEYYLKEINRVLKENGYFYSLNTTEDSQWGIGSHRWNYQANYLTLMYNFDNRFAYPQWLGKKVNNAL
ncbi:putative sugar O-methyltransferase [bacterium]|nr:putative sugar O-methyltransferase [bacterium]MBU1958253.1 putative sugar O-methyltransferase [bacterium]